jgi:hypothetical protein
MVILIHCVVVLALVTWIWWEQWKKLWHRIVKRATVLEEPRPLAFTGIPSVTEHPDRIRFDKLQDAAKKLYMAGVWRCSTLSHDDQVRLWTELRDAAEIPAGTATAAGVGEKMVLIPASANRGVIWTKDDAAPEWKAAGLDINVNCLCVDCPYLDTCEWAYDLYNTKPGEPGWDCLGAK